jgi:hypothetical protein
MNAAARLTVAVGTAVATLHAAHPVSRPLTLRGGTFARPFFIRTAGE